MLICSGFLTFFVIVHLTCSFILPYHMHLKKLNDSGRKYLINVVSLIIFDSLFSPLNDYF